MSEHSPKIRTPDDQELANAITLAYRRGAYLLVGALRELQALRFERQERIAAENALTVAELKFQLDKDRRAKI